MNIISSNVEKNDIYILGIETSCDETAASVVKNGRYVLSNIISSQIQTHRKFGGVVPEIASRKHIENIEYVVKESLEYSNLELDKIDAIAVTYGPGLVGALITGLSFAKSLAFATNKTLIGIHHIEGHICSNYITDTNYTPPFICLVVSGGHTHLVHVHDYNKFEILGKTRDDAAGEAYDKVARSIGLSYPGGVMIDNLSKEGNPYAINFPRVYLEEGSLDFSFSGLKSSVLNYLNKSNMQNEQINKADVAASFQQAIIDVLVKKSITACTKRQINKLAIAGGVASNSFLRKQMKEACIQNNIQFNVPLPIYCTDNAAMIASCGYYEYINGVSHSMNLNAYPNLEIGKKVL